MTNRTATQVLCALALAAIGCSSSSAGSSNKVQMNGTCPTNTGFVGDDQCLAPPSATEGFQLHYGPSDYDDPDEVAKFTLPPGQESLDCFFELSPNTSDIFYSGYEFQMRPGSHHLIAQSRNAPGQAVTPPVTTQGFAPCDATDEVPAGLFGGTQTPKVDERVDPAPENQGLGREVPAATQAVLNFHVINTSDVNTLREAWLNYYYIDQDQMKGQRGAVDLNGGLGYYITPGTHQNYDFSCSPDRPIRILDLAAHMHAHAKRMTIWKVSGGVKTTVLVNYSWEDPVTLFYDTAHTNTPANPTSQTPGGDFSGDLTLEPTDTLQWECEVDNDSDTVLTFRNEVYTGEMCLVAGSLVNTDDPMTVYNFQCNRN